MTSHRPYLLRAMHEWILDNDLTPYVIVNTTERRHVDVPPGHAENGRIVLNVSPTAIRNLEHHERTLWNSTAASAAARST